MNYRYLSIFIVVLLVLPSCVNHIQKKSEQSEQTSINNVKPVNELILTLEENNALGKWKDKSMDDVLMDAIAGDAAAQYMIGFSHLCGLAGCPIDTSISNDFFDQSASLGFPPAIDKLRFMYFEDKENLFLAMVYLNLVISLGHSELAQMYIDLRSKLISTFGLEVIKEIERISIHKQKIIANNKARFDGSDTFENNSKNMFKIKRITKEDVLFESDYWQSAYKGNAPENLEAYINENYCVIIEKNAQEAEKNIERLKENYR